MDHINIDNINDIQKKLIEIKKQRAINEYKINNIDLLIKKKNNKIGSLQGKKMNIKKLVEKKEKQKKEYDYNKILYKRLINDLKINGSDTLEEKIKKIPELFIEQFIIFDHMILNNIENTFENYISLLHELTPLIISYKPIFVSRYADLYNNEDQIKDFIDIEESDTDDDEINEEKYDDNYMDDEIKKIIDKYDDMYEKIKSNNDSDDSDDSTDSDDSNDSNDSDDLNEKKNIEYEDDNILNDIKKEFIKKNIDFSDDENSDIEDDEENLYVNLLSKERK